MNPTFDTSGDPLCLANIRACAEASRLAYRQPTLTESGESVLIQDCGNALVIAFPGTHDLRDVLRDLDCVRVRATILGRPCSVHAGFARSHEALRPVWSAATCRRFQSADMSAQSIIKKIFLTGHSKGAAVAKRCALSLLENNLPVHAVITFGEPRGGDSRYAAIYRDVLGQRTLRVTNAADPVPWLPAWLAGNRHCGPEAWLPPDSCSQPSTPNPQLILGPRLWWKLAQNFREIYDAWQLKQLTPLNDHHIDNYLRRLNAL